MGGNRLQSIKYKRKGQVIPMDYSAIIVGVLALAGTLIGSMLSNNKTQALVIYRLQQLEEKVNKHNNIVERMYRIEEKQMVMEEQIKVANHRILDLEEAQP